MTPGAYFGIVPREIWSRQFQADERGGKVRLSTNLLLVESGGVHTLIDTGMTPPGWGGEDARHLRCAGPRHPHRTPKVDGC
ncbi:hypothetical protein [Thermogymnomonas acidicola]|uniref:hypothetical protein n=1 Tax=Thermogymnomonas acidicola TaxID=399579 RepID=UPI001396BBE2|nr:hypothetical protein [Thermogymnomonas acidicola]